MASPVSQPSTPLTRLPFFYGWVILGVASAVAFSSGPGQTYAVSVFLDPIIDDFGWSRTLVSGLYSAGSLTAALTMILVGRMLDRFGARVMLVGLGILFGFVALSMSQIDHPVHLYVGFAAIRILGQGSLTLVPTTLVAIWFVRKRGRATALMSLGMALSQAAFPLIIHLLITSVGWRGAWIGLAFIIWGVVVLPSLLLVRRSPESVGLLPDGDARPAPIAEAMPSKVAQEAGVAQEQAFSLGEAMRTRAFWLLLFAGAGQSLIGTALIFHQISLLGSRGLDASVAASVFAVLAPSSLVGAFTAGFLTDLLPNRLILAVCQLLLVLAMVWVFAIAQPWQAFVYGAGLGLSGGASLTTMTVIWANYYGRPHLGSIRGAAQTSMVGFAALGPLPFGFIFDLTGTYSTAILVFLALPIACSVAALFAVPPRKVTHQV